MVHEFSLCLKKSPPMCMSKQDNSDFGVDNPGLPCCQGLSPSGMEQILMNWALETGRGK